jgi:hypothetical protein
MASRPQITRLALVACGVVALTIGAATAFALVKVYSNDFSKGADADSLAVSGKGCGTKYDDANKRLDIFAKQGPARCRLKVPVQGDSAQPDQAIGVTTKLDKSLPKSVAKKAYFAVTLRDGAGGLYEFRIYPAVRRYSLERTPDANGFPVEGREKSIGKAGERNFIRLQVIGDTIKAKVNGKGLDPVTDQNASELAGRRMTVTFGVDGKSSDGGGGWVDDILVQVPTP